jgi:hypothetical protein
VEAGYVTSTAALLDVHVNEGEQFWLWGITGPPCHWGPYIFKAGVGRKTDNLALQKGGGGTLGAKGKKPDGPNIY